ncbi:NAD-dependent epimerase/dehydratase family protein [Staphylococcus sp. FDAARGOS_39]|uniref:NAD-dependent epimerase/dehydratase family protein n=1 Tax=Staphylococcus sp. FDAARGOS_39 TaxID=2201033 RepID=UPI000A48C11D
MKIVVIGATGTIGKSVSKKLKENNHEVIEVGSKSGDYQLDITSPTEIEQMYKDIKDIDAVVSATEEQLSNPYQICLEENVAIKSKLLDNLVLIGQHYLNKW